MYIFPDHYALSESTYAANCSTSNAACTAEEGAPLIVLPLCDREKVDKTRRAKPILYATFQPQ